MGEAGVALPVLVSGTIEPMGTMLAGQSVDAPVRVGRASATCFSIGLNCATGPEFMTDHLRTLSSLATFPVSCFPNAGLPDEHGQYKETPESLALQVGASCDEGWVNLVGGCCGTTPAHIRALAELVQGKPPRRPRSAWPPRS